MSDFLVAYGGAWATIAWDLVVAVFVPILSAGIAAWVVIAQVRQLDRHRVADRKGEAILHLTSMATGMTRLVDAVMKNQESPNERPSWSDRFPLNEQYVNAMTLLEPQNQDVARWVNQVVDDMWDEAATNYEIQSDPGDSTGLVRSASYKTAANVMQQLLSWQRGDCPTSWFTSALR